jgi:hypothetical protein
VLSSSSRAAGRDSAKQATGSGELETLGQDLKSARTADLQIASAPHESSLGGRMTGPTQRATPAVNEPPQKESIRLIPPAIVHQIGSNGRAAKQMRETGAGVHIGSLEIHVAPPPTPPPPSPLQAWSVPPVKPATVRLARGFRLFGLVQG